MNSLQQKLNQLNLTTMSQHLDETLTHAASKNLSAAEAFVALLDRELERGKPVRSIAASGSLACKPSTPSTASTSTITRPAYSAKSHPPPFGSRLS